MRLAAFFRNYFWVDYVLWQMVTTFGRERQRKRSNNRQGRTALRFRKNCNFVFPFLLGHIYETQWKPRNSGLAASLNSEMLKYFINTLDRKETSDQLVICLLRGHVPEGSGFKDFKLPTGDNFLHHYLKEFDYLT
jgi:hypothetical protein